ncbi:MAG: hypothetical protein RL247_142 [Actinomycetota bacterium]|jgi:hypothetical protein
MLIRKTSPFISISLVAVLLAGCSDTAEPTPNETESTTPAEATVETLDTCGQVSAGYIVQMPDGEFEVCEGAGGYADATGELTSLPATSASFALSGYGLGSTQSGTTLNHPASGASDGTHLAIADRFNNRVLIYSSLPTTTQAPDIVVGQPNFTDTTPGDGLADLNWPGAIELTPQGSLLIADTENGRILVYNKVPSTNGAAADFALDLAALTGNNDAWPWGIWSDGDSLVVTDTRKGKILVWESFPTNSNSPPSVVSSAQGVGTPRNITSDGTNFLIGDENGSQDNCWGEPTQNRQRQSHIWVNRLPIGDPDGCVWDWYQGDASELGVIALAAGGQDAHYWPAFPVDDATALDRTTTGSGGAMGQPAPPAEGEPPAPGEPPQPGSPAPGQPSPGGPNPQSGIRTISNPSESSGHSYLGGDGGDVVVTSTAIYFIEYNGNRVTGWLGLPADMTGKKPDFSLFDSDPEVSTLLRDGFIQNPVLVNAGGALVASSDYDRRMYVWNTAPAQDGAPADFIYLTGFPAWDNTYAEGTLVIAGRDSLAIWDDFTPGDLPTRVMKSQVGSLTVSDLKGVAFDGTYFAIADGQNDVVAVFEGIPETGQAPLRSYETRGPGRLDMVSGVLAIAPKEGSEIFVVDVTTGDSPRALPVRANLPNQAKFLPFGFAVADTSFHRVQVWESVEAAQRGETPALIIGGEMGDRPQTTADRFYFPASVEVVGETFYVGEFKFSNRILAFAGQ